MAKTGQGTPLGAGHYVANALPLHFAVNDYIFGRAPSPSAAELLGSKGRP